MVKRLAVKWGQKNEKGGGRPGRKKMKEEEVFLSAPSFLPALYTLSYEPTISRQRLHHTPPFLTGDWSRLRRNGIAIPTRPRRGIGAERKSAGSQAADVRAKSQACYLSAHGGVSVAA